MRVSNMAENLIGSEIIKLGGEIRDRILQGEHIYNFTIGDFNPKIFPIPAALKADILEAYENDLTNYPVANGAVELRKAVVKLLKEKQDLNYDPEEILVAGGARPIIYAIFQAIVDPGDKVLFPVPSWNNNHYTHLSHANQVFVETLPEENFMPNADVLREHVKGASLLALCSPLNPTGTVFSKDQLESICDLVLEENASRGENEKPLYVMYDQIYSLLTFGYTQHFDPVSLRPEMRKYTVYVDGISKSLAATGVRVGWGFGPAFIIDRMKSILGHVGAWAPRPEQMALGKYLDNIAQVDAYLSWIKEELQARLNGFYQGITRLKDAGFPVQAIPPAAAIYLTVQFNLIGKKMANGDVLQTTGDVTAYLLNEAKVALVPFRAFGASEDSTWYRLSVGTASTSDVEASILAIESAMAKLV
ncbi:MAG: pyridoxal phosphate-dependent aminotransferase [Bacteroidetes bacterium]|nr:pyridoxal phosphate-dependent aminotransferase [Bacteroidota bacterium]